MEFMIEIVVTAFAMGGVFGAIIALHLSANLKHNSSQASSVTKSESAHSPELQRIPVETHSKHSDHANHKQH